MMDRGNAMNRMAVIAGAFCVAWTALTGVAVANPNVQCTFNADKSQVLMMGSNPGDTAFRCVASCRVTVAGQRALERFECNFNLAKNAGEKAVCDRKGGGPNFYTALSPTKMTCAPRN